MEVYNVRMCYSDYDVQDRVGSRYTRYREGKEFTIHTTIYTS